MKRINFGFTLIEMLVMLLLIAVLAGIGIPSFTQLVRNNQITAQANGLLGALQYARSEAIRQGGDVSVCGSSDGATCDGAWGAGWVVFSVDASNNRQVLRVSEGATGLTASGGVATITYSSNGLLGGGSGNGTIRIEHSSGCGNEGRRGVVITATGRAHIVQEACA
ncbi:GspH/FimT family pseudopilin [Alcanivorax sp. JB21]|uniref:GspH/FimT family pseudopilin n=1 Tax=Alcanivorax limicola TaxID=2874102 RepID=UPI001CBE72CB|nr:GspH/FimT family pseudopilin [Alcanivorax limicola]MBZ2189418.1 GspH/FimT family pseudopilin [Alcanivorax limicola]